MTKVEVLEEMCDKYDPNIRYYPGDVLEWDDKERIKSAVDRGLVKVISEPAEKPAAKRTTKKKAE